MSDINSIQGQAMPTVLTPPAPAPPANPPAPPAPPAPAPPAPAAPTYLDQVKTELRDNALLKGLSGVNELAERAIALNDNQTIPWKPGMTAEETAKYNKMYGIPEDKAKYTKLNGISADRFVKAGISPDQAAQLFDGIELENEENQKELFIQKRLKVEEDGKKIIQKFMTEFGDDWPGKNVQLQKGMNFLSPELRQLLVESELGNNEILLRDLIRLGETQQGEARMVDSLFGSNEQKKGDAFDFST